MRRVVIASHHGLADGFRDTLEFVCGAKNIQAVAAYMDDESCLEREIECIFEGFSPEDEVLVMTDMMQGSVNQAFLKYVGEHVFLVTGINLPCALELVLYPSPLSVEGIRGVIDRSREQLLLVNDQIVEIDENDE